MQHVLALYMHNTQSERWIICWFKLALCLQDVTINHR